MKRTVFMLSLLLCLLCISFFSSATYYKHEIDKCGIHNPVSYNGKYKLNTFILEQYNIVSYGEPFGNFLKTEWGRMTNKQTGEKGEYQYLGYDFNEIIQIPNDRYFYSESSFGKLFNSTYSNVTWIPHSNPSAVFLWGDLLMRFPDIIEYMETTQFWDSDHITAAKQPSGYTLLSFSQQVLKKNPGDYIYYGEFVTAPTKNTSGKVKFYYIKANGEKDYNSVDIPPLPNVECVMTATPDITHIPAGTTRDVTITIDTGLSTVEFMALQEYKISDRYYWASVNTPSGGGKKSTESVYQITVPNVAPNTLIHVKARVFSQQIADLNIPGAEPDDDAEATIFIGEIPAPVTVENVSNTSTSASAVIKADQRGNERFDVALGIPSGESLYVNVSASEYLYRFVPQQITGSVTYTVTVEYPSEGQEGEPITETTVVPVSRSYSYWDVTSLEVYGIKEAVVNNSALPGGKVSLTPAGGYKKPVVDFRNTASPVSTGSTSITTSCSSSNPADILAAAYSAAPSPTVRNDGLIINGKVVLSDSATSSHASGPSYSNLTPGIVGGDTLYASNLRIPESTSNGSKASSGSITYERVYDYKPTGRDTETFPLGSINPVYVHTPVVISALVSSDDAHNQSPVPLASNTSAIILGRPFTVQLSNTGSHRNIRGYGSRDYTAYVGDRQIRFGFDAYLGTSMAGTYLKAGTWHSLEGLGIANDVSSITFYTPTWVDEQAYTIEVRSLATNDTTNGAASQDKANTDASRYAASTSCQVRAIGRVYDLKITDVDDIAWETFFRVTKGKPDATGKVFYTGPNNINGTVDSARKYVLPVMPGKNDVAGYSQKAVKLGYAVKFELKTMGNYYDELDFVQILPSFWFVDKNGKNRIEVDLYYSTPSKPLIKVGSPEDTLTHSMKLNFPYRGINTSEFVNTAEAMFKLRGGMKGYTLEKWMDAFPRISQSGVTVSKYYKLLLSEPIRSFVGPDKGIPQGVSTYKALASVQKWYGEYYLPSDCLAVPKGTDLSKYSKLTSSSPVFLKDGYIMVNFRDISVINNDDFNQPALKYTGNTADGWVLEGYNTNQNGWQLMPGDFVVYYADQKSTDDSTSTGTH